jgi:hypothetical protein
MKYGHWWFDNGGEKQEHSGKNTFQCQSHDDCPRLISEPSGEEVVSQRPGMAKVTIGHST